MLHREIVRYDGTENDYVEKLKYALLSKKERARFPDDDEFATAFSERQIYLMNAKNKIYILERLENAGTAEDKDIYRHCDAGEYSIEHIMPRHLTPAWVEELGENYQKVHEVWLHRIANLTLVAATYNSRYSNSSFEEKKSMKNGFSDSGIRLNAFVEKQNHWTEAEMKERSRSLTKEALEIWNLPKTEYKPKEKQMDSYTLDDDASALIGRQIARLSYKNAEQPVTSWVDAYQKVLRMLFAQDQSILMQLAVSKEDNLAYHFSMNAVDFAKCVEVGNGIYVWTNTSTQSKLSVLTRLFKLYDEDPTNLVFYLREENEIDKDEPGSRYELRRKYWTFALPIIKGENQGGAFANVNPSKNNCVGGFFGVGGFSILCVANFDAARVELYLEKGEKEANKEAFDLLFVHKTEIEQKLGVPLEWSRNDEGKSAKVGYEMPDVSISDETDWKRMAQFHAEWSKKFYDTLVPYLVNAKQ